MGSLPFTTDPHRMGLYLPMGQTRESPSLIIPFYKMDKSELEHIVRANLDKQGITDESYIQDVIIEAETQYENRRKVHEASKELKRLMTLKAEGAKLMQLGAKKWREVYYPAIKRL